MQYFTAPEKSLGGLDAEATATLVATAADIVLILNAKGVIKDIAVGNEDLAGEEWGSWVGRKWTDIVTIESRPKVEALLKGAADQETPRWRQLNHPSSIGDDLPILYNAVSVGDSKRVVAVGRELRAIASLQQRLVDAQQSMEREYERLRNAETRYRLLFQIASEAVLIVDTATLKVVEANPAAAELLSQAPEKVVGGAFWRVFQTAYRKPIEAYLATVEATGEADGIVVRSRTGETDCALSAALFRQDDSTFFLVRLTSREEERSGALTREQSHLLDVIEQVPDGFVVTDMEGRVLTANQAFLDLAQLVTERQVLGHHLDRWLGRSGVDINVLVSKLREHGTVKFFATKMQGEYGATADVEISGVAVLSGDHPCLGFTFRNVGRRLPAPSAKTSALPRSVEHLTELVGRVPLKQVVQETTDMIERLCIEAALELTGDNRASAAEVLGLSRQSLYSKLHRHGLGELSTLDDK